MINEILFRMLYNKTARQLGLVDTIVFVGQVTAEFAGLPVSHLLARAKQIGIQYSLHRLASSRNRRAARGRHIILILVFN